MGDGACFKATLPYAAQPGAAGQLAPSEASAADTVRHPRRHTRARPSYRLHPALPPVPPTHPCSPLRHPNYPASALRRSCSPPTWRQRWRRCTPPGGTVSCCCWQTPARRPHSTRTSRRPGCWRWPAASWVSWGVLSEGRLHLASSFHAAAVATAAGVLPLCWAGALA